MSRSIRKDSYTGGRYDGLAFFACAALLAACVCMGQDLQRMDAQKARAIRITKVEIIPVPKRKPVQHKPDTEVTQGWERELFAAISDATERHMKPVKGYPLPVPDIYNHK